MTDHDYRQAVKASQPANNSGVFRESLVTVKLDEIFKQPFDHIERVRAVGVSSKLHTLESSSLPDRFCVVGFFFLLFGHSGFLQVNTKALSFATIAQRPSDR
jgi:hypothetical protein